MRGDDLEQRVREAFAAYRGIGRALIDELLSAYLRARAEAAGEQEARERCVAALREKDRAMAVLFERLRKANVDYSDLIP